MVTRPFPIRAALAGLALLAATATLIVPAQPASAHPTGSSALTLQFAGDGLQFELQVPVSDLEKATGLFTGQDQRSTDAVAAEMVRQVVFTAPGGGRYETTIDEVWVDTVNGVPTVVGSGVAIPPSGDRATPVTVAAELVIGSDERHSIYVSLAHDSGQRELVGILTTASPSVSIADVSPSASLAEMIGHGMHHIADGYDHLLFLGLLLVVAPLALSKTRPHRWVRDQGKSTRRTIVRVVTTVTAFTVGHSIALLIVGLGWVAVPARLVESLVAVTIVITAAHCIRPIFGHREALIAGVFGVVHGSAFATTILDLNLPLWDSALAIVGFNLGIEFAQLVGVALSVPFLAVASASRGYRGLRVVIALTNIASGIGWFIAIQFDTASIFEPVFEAIGAYPIAAYLVFLTVMLALARPHRSPQKTAVGAAA